MERLGQQAEITLLAGLRRTSQLVAPLARVLDENAPTVAALHEDDLDLLLDRLDDLADADVEVRFPSELIAPRIERKLVIAAEPAPTGAMASVLDLDSLLTVDWEFLIEDVALTKEELAVLGDAKRAVVPLRGKWVQLDRAARERLKTPPPVLTTGDVLSAAMNGTFAASLDDEEIDVRFEGAVAGLSARLIRSGGSRGWPTCVRWVSAACWPMTWAWARPSSFCRSTPCAPVRRSSCAPPRC